MTKPVDRLVRVSAAALIGFGAAAAFAGASAAQTAWVEGEAVVTFAKSVTAERAAQAVAHRSLRLARRLAVPSERGGQEVGLVCSEGLTTAELIADLQQDSAVQTAEPNYLRWPCGELRPNDPRFGELWGLRNTGQPVNGAVGTPGSDTRFPAAWGLARTSGAALVVAVIDTGVDYTHPDLVDSMWQNAGETADNGVDDDANGYRDDVRGYDFAAATADPIDVGYHGTHVAGTIAAGGNNGLGVIGVAPGVRIMPLKASSDGTTMNSAAVIAAVQYATTMKTRGVNVVAINASYAGGGYSAAERSAIQAANDAGIVFCAAAGNSSNDNDVVSTYPASYRLPGMIVVAASDANDALASFSNYGDTTVDLAAPGVGILSTLPTVRGTNAFVQASASRYAGLGMSYAGLTTGVTATVYDCGLGYPTNFPAAVRGQIALIARGTLFFSEKVANAMAAGARAAIVYNNASGGFAGSLRSPGDWIPAVSIAQADGLALRAALPTAATVVNADRCYQFLNGTSMAAPHVSAAVAFAALNFPADSVAQRIRRILDNVDGSDSLSGRVVTAGRLNLRRIVDADGDDLPDWWESAHLGGPANGEPAADPDRDGADNRAEWLAGSSPTNAASCLRLGAVASLGTNGVAVRWQSAQGRSYRLEGAVALGSGFASTVATHVVATPPMNTATDAAAWGAGSRFYRLVLEE